MQIPKFDPTLFNKQNQDKIEKKTITSVRDIETVVNSYVKMLNNISDYQFEVRKLGAINSKEDLDKQDDLKKSFGIYIFVMNSHFEYALEHFHRDVLLYKIRDDSLILSDYQLCSPYNDSFIDSIKFETNPVNFELQKNHAFYIGMKKTNLYSRISEHLFNSNDSGTKSLKLGFESREKIRKFLDIYVVEFKDVKVICNISKIETHLRDIYYPYFGK